MLKTRLFISVHHHQSLSKYPVTVKSSRMQDCHQIFSSLNIFGCFCYSTSVLWRWYTPQLRETFNRVFLLSIGFQEKAATKYRAILRIPSNKLCLGWCEALVDSSIRDYSWENSESRKKKKRMTKFQTVTIMFLLQNFRDSSVYFINAGLSTTFVRLCQYCVNFCILLMKSKTLVSYEIDFTSVFPFQNAFKKKKRHQ